MRASTRSTTEARTRRHRGATEDARLGDRSGATVRSSAFHLLPVHLDTFRDYALSLPSATEDQPFGPDALVFKVGGKMFARLSLGDTEARVTLKCDPERALELREQYDGVAPGYHMSKRHWNTVTLQSDVPGEAVRDLTDHSYALVRAGLTRAMRETLG